MKSVASSFTSKSGISGRSLDQSARSGAKSSVQNKQATQQDSLSDGWTHVGSVPQPANHSNTPSEFQSNSRDVPEVIEVDSGEKKRPSYFGFDMNCEDDVLLRELKQNPHFFDQHRHFSCHQDKRARAMIEGYNSTWMSNAPATARPLSQSENFDRESPLSAPPYNFFDQQKFLLGFEQGLKNKITAQFNPGPSSQGGNHYEFLKLLAQKQVDSTPAHSIFATVESADFGEAIRKSKAKRILGLVASGHIPSSAVDSEGNLVRSSLTKKPKAEPHNTDQNLANMGFSAEQIKSINGKPDLLQFLTSKYFPLIFKGPLTPATRNELVSMDATPEGIDTLVKKLEATKISPVDHSSAAT